MLIAANAVKPITSAIVVGTMLAPFGIPIDELGWGAVFFSLGIILRACVEILSCVERNDTLDRKLFVRWGVWCVIGTVASFGITSLWLAFVMGMGWPVSAWTVVVLLGAGYGGPKGVNKIMELVNNRASSQFPTVGALPLGDKGDKDGHV